MRFRHLSIEEGMSQSTVEAIVQDRWGYIWIGTEDGLNRFDGNEFTVFRNDPGDPGSISNNNIWCLFVDRDGFLWIGTYNSGLNRYDPRNGSFTSFVHDPDDPGSISSDRIRSISEDFDGTVWVGTRGGGLNRLDREAGAFQRFIHESGSENSLPSDNVRYVCPDTGGALWVATIAGFSRFYPATGTFENYRAGRSGSNSLVHDNVKHILRDRQGILWISTAGGLSRFDPSTGRFTNFVHDESDPESISSNNIRKVFEDSRGRLMVATTNRGLCMFDRDSQAFTSFLHNPADPHSLSHNSTRVIFEDMGGLLWVGTMGGGLNIHDTGTGRFRHYSHDPSDANSLSDRIIWSVAQGPDGDIWFGTNTGDLNRYDVSAGRYEVIPGVPEKHGGGGPKYIRSLLWDDEDRLWVSSASTGIYRFDPDDRPCLRLVHQPENANSLGNNQVRYIHRDTSGDMWFCTTNRGLDHYDPETGLFTHFTHDPNDPLSISSDNTSMLMHDSRNIYWLATRNGLNRIEFSRTGTGTGPEISIAGITRLYHDSADPRSLSNSYILTIHESRSGDIWIGTMQGLSRLKDNDRDDPVFSRYFTKDGLPNDVIYGILEDDDGKLWISTNFGISCLDPETEIFKNYDTRDGLHGNEFNTNVRCATSEGTFIFGGVGGATEFDPDSLRASDFNAPVVLTGFNIFDKPAELKRPILSTKEITLSHSDNYFSFEFASLDYSKPDRNHYSYILEGLDREWTNAGNRRYAGYTHVDPGKYIFKVRGTNGDGVWSDQTASVGIIITPPFWRTWWFITMIVLAVAGSIAGAITYRVRQLLAIERLRSKIAADLHDDIGAGLTEISIMGEVITNKLPAESKDIVTSEIDRIREISRHLVDSMSDIVWLVNPRRDSLFDLISRLGDSFKETLHAEGINFKVQNLESLKNIRLDMEYRQNLFLIFKEALNNSLKYSSAGEISLDVQVSGRKLTMRLIDDGKGFDPGEARDGNGLRNMKKRAARIHGALTVDSAPGKGASIDFRGHIA